MFEDIKKKDRVAIVGYQTRKQRSVTKVLDKSFCCGKMEFSKATGNRVGINWYFYYKADKPEEK